MSSILSYYEKMGGIEIKEFLHEHIYRGLYLIENLKKSKLFKYTNSFLKNFGESLTLYDLSRLSIIFHDVGKFAYQENKRKDKFGREYISFIGHEILSAYIFNLFNDFLYHDKIGTINEAVFFAIYFHHHAMNVNLRRKNLQKLRLFERINFNNLHELTFIKQFLNKKESLAFDEVIATIKMNIGKNLLDDILYETNHHLKRNVWEMFVSDPLFKRLCFATLLVLITVDYLSSQNRSGERTRFFNVLKEFYNFYLS